MSVTWMSGSVTACGVATNGQGGATCTYTIPATPAGQYTFTGSDSSPHTATAMFVVDPTLTASNTSGLVDTTVTFSGTSYAASSSVSVTWSGGTACTSTTNTAGDFSCTYMIPAGTVGGTYTFTGTDGSSNRATVSFTDTPRMKISADSGSVGKTITFKGTGFAVNSSVAVDWASGQACNTTTSSTGTFSCSLKIPATTDGSYLFNATDANFNSALASYKVTPKLTATPTSGTVGSSTIFSGTGYTGHSAITVSWSGGTACSSTTSGVGSFACSFTVPATAAGLYSFTGTDASSKKASATYTVDPKLTDSPTSGPTGTTVTFTGTGYAGTSAVTVSWSGGTACTAITSVAGNFSCTFAIPTGTTTGSYTFTGTDAQSNTATVSFKVT